MFRRGFCGLVLSVGFVGVCLAVADFGLLWLVGVLRVVF